MPHSSNHQEAGQHYARLYLGNIQFPSTRHVLWCVQPKEAAACNAAAQVLTCRDRRVLAERITISSRQILPRVTIANSALKEIYRLYRAHVETERDRLRLQSASVLGYLHGETATRSAKPVTLSVVMPPKVRSCACILMSEMGTDSVVYRN